MKFKTLNEKVNIQKRIGWILSFKNGLGYKHGFDARIGADKDGVFVEVVKTYSFTPRTIDVGDRFYEVEKDLRIGDDGQMWAKDIIDGTEYYSNGVNYA